jgi:hypothetical protein
VSRLLGCCWVVHVPLFCSESLLDCLAARPPAYLGAATCGTGLEGSCSWSARRPLARPHPHGAWCGALLSTIGKWSLLGQCILQYWIVNEWLALATGFSQTNGATCLTEYAASTAMNVCLRWSLEPGWLHMARISSSFSASSGLRLGLPEHRGANQSHGAASKTLECEFQSDLAGAQNTCAFWLGWDG